jgi:serine/threonine protein kinase
VTLTPGARLGPYEIVSLLGVGGMGEVYCASDTRLKRQVAIKVLPEAVTGEPDRLARFQREAEVLASLNHPNIAQIYGIEYERLRPRRAEDKQIRGEASSAPSQANGTVTFAKVAVERSERHVTSLTAYFQHQAVRETNSGAPKELLKSGQDSVCILHRQCLVIEQHVHGCRDGRAISFVHRLQHPRNFGQSQVRYPCALADERLRGRHLLRVVTGDKADENVGINGSHGVSACAV